MSSPQPEGALVYLDAALVLDNCDPAPTLTNDAPPDHLFPVGTTIVTYTAEDESGNRATATTTVTVTPWIPALSAQGPRVLNVPDQGTFTASGGQQPYTWTVSDPAIAKIIGETTGASVTVQGVGPGYCTVSVHDSCSQEVHLSLLVVLFAGPEDARTCVNHEITLTATAEPLGSNTCNPVLWSCDGDPATGDGLSFTTKFSTPGAHVVHVTYEVEGLQFSAQCTVTAVTVAGISPPGPLTVCRGKTLTFTAISDPPGGFGECLPVWSGTSGASASGVSIDVIFNTVSTDEADFKTVEVSCPSDPENVHTALVLVVQLDHMDYVVSDGRQGTVDATTLTVCRGASVTFTAYNQVGLTDFPADCPEWSGTSGVTGTGAIKTVPFATTSATNTDLKTVIATCAGTVTASVLVVEIDRIQYRYFGQASFRNTPESLTVEAGTDVTFKAVAWPPGSSFPPNCPSWGGAATGTGGTVTVTFPAATTTTVTATCGRTVTVTINVVPIGWYSLGEIQNWAAIDPDFFYAEDVHVPVAEALDWRVVPAPGAIPVHCYSTLAWSVWSMDGIDRQLLVGAGQEFRYAVPRTGAMRTYYWKDTNHDALRDWHEYEVHADFESAEVKAYVIDVAVSRSIPVPMTAAQATAILDDATTRIKGRDTADDRRACARFQLGSFSLFWASPSGSIRPDPVRTLQDYDNLVDNVSATVRVISDINIRNPPKYRNAIGLCKHGKLSSVVVEAGYVGPAGGHLWAHEFGHGVGIPGDYDDPRKHDPGSVMWEHIGNAGNILTNWECRKYEGR